MSKLNVHYEFNQWKPAFERFYLEKQWDDTVALVISTSFYSSGYWIENGSPRPSHDAAVYSEVEDVKALEARVRNLMTRNEHSLVT